MAKIELTANEAEAVLVTNHGIYSEVSIDAQHPESHNLVEKIRAAHNSRSDHRELPPLQLLTALRQRMRTIISLAVVEEGSELPKRWATITADLGDGVKTYLCSAERVAGVEEAASVLTEVDLLFLDHPSERESRLFLRGIDAGRLLEKMERLLPVEPFVKSEKARREGARKGGKETRKWTPEIEEIARKIFAHEKRGNVSDDAAYRRTAAKLKAEYGVSLSKGTIRRHLS